MYMGRCVYNALSKFAGRVKMQLGTAMVSVGSMAILAGITIMLLDPASRSTGGIIGLLGLAMTLGGYFKAQADDERELNKQRYDRTAANNILSEIKNMSEAIRDIKGLVQDIRGKK